MDRKYYKRPDCMCTPEYLYLDGRMDLKDAYWPDGFPGIDVLFDPLTPINEYVYKKPYNTLYYLEFYDQYKTIFAIIYTQEQLDIRVTLYGNTHTIHKLQPIDRVNNRSMLV